MQIDVHNTAGSVVGKTNLDESVWGIEPNISVMHQALLRQQANARLGTHQTKTRSFVSGGGRKPWKQKGTGRARQGSIRAPQWIGGGVVFGPHPRSYEQDMPRQMRRLAIRSALSAKVKDNLLTVVEGLSALEPKTKAMKAAVEALGRAADAADALAEWRDDPRRIVASLVDLDEATAIQERAHAAYATFAGVTEPLVERQDSLDAALVTALVDVERAADAAGLGASLGKLLAEAMPGIVEAADEMARAHVTPLR